MSRAAGIIAIVVLAFAAAAHAQEPPVRDPMRPYVVVRSADASTRAEQGLELTGVLVSDTRRIAVINGRFYRVGDRVNGEEIVRIEPGSIQIRRGNEQVVVTVRDANANTVEDDGDQDL